MARAKARICLWPTDKLLPPLEILLSSMSCTSPTSSCSENSPAKRSASLSVKSSCSSNGSRLRRRVPKFTVRFHKSPSNHDTITA